MEQYSIGCVTRFPNGVEGKRVVMCLQFDRFALRHFQLFSPRVDSHAAFIAATGPHAPFRLGTGSLILLHRFSGSVRSWTFDDARMRYKRPQ